MASTRRTLPVFTLAILTAQFGCSNSLEGQCTSESCQVGEAGEPVADCYNHPTDDIVEWVTNHGGFVDERLKIDGGVYGRGFFATGDIEKGENIVSVPASLILKDGDHPCHTVAMLRDELIKGRCSKYWPYLKFIKDVEMDLPDAWSTDELQVLDLLPPGDWRMHTSRMLKDCPTKAHLPMNDPFAMKALYYYATRAGPEGMQPIFDIFNHGYNSTWHFMEEKEAPTSKHTFQTTSHIKAGSEVFNQFRPGVGPGIKIVANMVKHGRTPDGAPEIFRDYGFIEPPPTLWHFTQEDRKHSFIVEDENFTVSFLPGKSYNWKRFVKDLQDYRKRLQAREAAFKDAGLYCAFGDQLCDGANSRRLKLGRLYRQTFKSALKFAHKAAKVQLAASTE